MEGSINVGKWSWLTRTPSLIVSQRERGSSCLALTPHDSTKHHGSPLMAAPAVSWAAISPTVRSVAVADSSEARRPPSIPNQHAYCSRISLQKVLKRRNDSMLMACLSVWRWCSAASSYCWEISVFEGQIPCYPFNYVLLVNEVIIVFLNVESGRHWKTKQPDRSHQDTI